MSNKPADNDIIQALWTAILRGTRLRHIRGNDPRIFVLRSINWARQETKVIDTANGEVCRFPWKELEFVDPVAAKVPGWPAPPAAS